MRVSRLENLSSEILEINLVGGSVIKLPSGGILEKIDVVNINELRNKASVILDLSEINERQIGTNSKRLDD